MKNYICHNNYPTINLLVGFFIGILFLLALLIGLLSFIPFSYVKPLVDSLGIHNKVDLFTPSYCFSFIFKLRLLSFTLFLCAVLSLIFIKQIIVNLSYYLSSINSSFHFYLNILDFKTIFKDIVVSYFLVYIFFIVVSIRIYYLNLPIRNDEAVSFIYFAAKPLFVGLSSYPAPNNHLFNTFLVHMSYLVFGIKLWAIRLPALIAGILLIPIVYLLVATYYNKYAAIIAAALVSSSSLLIEYSTNARGYTILVAIFLIILILEMFLFYKSNSLICLLFICLISIGFYTYPIMLFSLLIIASSLIIYSMMNLCKDNRRWFIKQLFITLSFTFIIIVLSYIPVIIVQGIKAIIANDAVKE